MKSILTAILLAVPSIALVACGSAVSGGTDYTKADARAIGGVDAQGNDICAAQGWYDDGVCDDFCPTGDANDCSIPSQCPSDSDPAVHYVGDPATCMTADWACAANQTPFDSEECGCGCIDVANPGTTCGGLLGAQCDDGFFCNFPVEAICGAADQTGTCEPIPDACPEYYGPVCGCDGQTYDNPCFAHGASVSVASDGACGNTGNACGGFAGLPCAAGEFCDYDLGSMCGAADQQGTCKPIPEACTEQYDPVCGCDGQTYGNACSANSAGVSVASNGVCGNTGNACGGLAGLQCGKGEYCDFPIEAMCGAFDQTGTCALIPEGCTLQYDPVCGCDGQTYGNACEAASAGVSVISVGVCP